MLTIKEINELTSGIEYHLRKLESFMNEMREMKDSLIEIKVSQEKQQQWEVEKLSIEITDIKNQLKKYGLTNSNDYELKFQQIKELISQDNWPMAANPESICDTEEKAETRANCILDLLITEYLKDKKFLDYGCGKGHIVQAAKKRGAFALGYDIDPAISKFESDFTTDWNFVKSHAPYDVILLHDVLDHLVGIDPIQALIKIKSVLNNEGTIYIRNHPWSSKHGGHLYEKINKAWLHLILDEVELERLGGYSCEHNLKILDPLETYKYWFEEAGLNIKSESPLTGDIPELLKKPSYVYDKLSEHWNGDKYKMFRCMEIEFVEYMLESKTSNQKIF